MLEYLTEASHISAGMGISFDEALEIVKAAHAEPEEQTEKSNVIHVDFSGRR